MAGGALVTLAAAALLVRARPNEHAAKMDAEAARSPTVETAMPAAPATPATVASVAVSAPSVVPSPTAPATRASSPPVAIAASRGSTLPLRVHRPGPLTPATTASAPPSPMARPDDKNW
jgi:hypothetical protein